MPGTGNITLVRPDGSTLSVSPERAVKLKRLGYEEQTEEDRSAKNVERLNEEKFTTFGQKVKTGLEGAISGATLGLADLGFTSEASRARAKYNPGTRLVTEVVGAIAPAILTGGGSIAESAAVVGAKEVAALTAKQAVKAGVKKGLSLTPAALVERGGAALGRAAGGGLKGSVVAATFEGGVGGMGAAITNAKLNNDPVTVEAMLAGGTMGAVIAGPLGAAGHALSHVKPGRVEDLVEGSTGRGARTTETVAYDPLDDFFASIPNSKATKGKAKAPWEAAANEPSPIKSTTTTRTTTVPDLEYSDHRFASAHSGIKSATDEILSAKKSLDGVFDDESWLTDIVHSGSVDKSFADDLDRLAQFEIDGNPYNLDGTRKAVKEDFRNAHVATDLSTVNDADVVTRNIVAGSSAAPVENKVVVTRAIAEDGTKNIRATQSRNGVTKVADGEYIPPFRDMLANPELSDLPMQWEAPAVNGRAKTKVLKAVEAPTPTPRKLGAKKAPVVAEDVLAGEGAALSADGTRVSRAMSPAEEALTNQIRSGKVTDAKSTLQEFSKLTAAADTLSTMPKSLKAFRAMKPAKAEEIIASLDVLGGRAEYKQLAEHFDGVLEDLGLTVEGSLGTKAKAIWETTNNPKYFKNVESTVTSKGIDLNDLKAYADTGAAAAGPGAPAPGGYDYVVDPGSSMPGVRFAPERTVTSRAGKSGGKARKTGGHPFWRRAVDSVIARGASKGARQLGLGIVGSGVAYELGGTAADMAMGGMFAATLSGGRTGHVGRIRDKVRKATPVIGRGLKTTSPRIGTLAVRIDGTVDGSARNDAKTTRKRIEEFNAVSPNIQNLAYQVAEPLVGQQPELAKAIYDTVVSAYKAVQTFLPKDPGNVFSKGVSTWVPSPIQTIQTGKALAVYHDPVGTIEKLIDSKVPDPFTTKVLAAVWPASYTEFQSELLLKLSDPSFMKSLDYGAQVYYSQITGVPIHSSMTSRSIAQIQNMYQQELENTNKAGPGGGSSGGGRPAKTEPPTLGQSLTQVG